MEEYGFYLLLTITLMVAHQGLCLVMLGRTGWSMMVKMAPPCLTSSSAEVVMVAYLISSVLINATIWMIIPTWVMVVQVVLFEAVAIRQLLKMRKNQQ